MISLFAAALAFQTKAASSLPSPTTISVPDDVRDWKGFKFLPEGPRTIDHEIPVAADWSGIRGEPAPDAVEWHAKIVLLERIDRPHERGPNYLWPGHHAILPPTVVRIKRALPQLRALVSSATRGAVNMTFDVSEEPEPLTVDGDLGTVVAHYLAPRVNGGRYQAEDGVFRGPYQSIFVVHPAGGERVDAFQVQGAPTSVLGLPDLEGQEADGTLAAWMERAWRGQALARARDTNMVVDDSSAMPFDWKAVVLGRDVPTDVRVKGFGKVPASIASPIPGDESNPWVRGPKGAETNVRLEKDSQRGSVLVVEEGGAYRGGGFVLPVVEGKPLDLEAKPTLSFWMKSDAKDPIVLQVRGDSAASTDKGKESSFRIGRDVPFAYDNSWHQVKVGLGQSGQKNVDLVIGPDREARAQIKNTLGPIVASFSDFELTTESPDSKPTPEPPSATSTDPDVRARWAATAEPGEDRRKLLRDPIDAVKANAVAAALAKPDPADEPMLIEDALYTFEPAVFTPALEALSNLKTPSATAAIKQALRIAAADRARGLAAEILAKSGDPHVAPTFVGLNQARSREARIEAIHALAMLSGSEAALLRMAYLAQDDPEVKLAVTETVDANDDYQGRKLLWSAVNEPSDAVRLESLRRLAASKVPAFADAGFKGGHDDSVGVRVGLLQTWTSSPSDAALPAIRIALADREPRVRAAALDALAANPAAVTPKDVPFDDPDPRVQIAALHLASAKSIATPDDVRSRLRKSPDPLVRKAVG